MVKTTRSVELEPLDRLEEKVKRLIATLERLRAEHTRAVEENGRLSREIEALRARLADAEGASAEMTALRAEREQIRSRVTEMLEQLEALNL